ncbi:MAG: flagellar basal body rod protein FlgB [Rhodospirillales bacterium]|nr:flagellar basal body rod protein FlgB [Rhodospirillales bacterium]
MDGKLSIFDALARRMAWLGQREQVLAQNVANADTPDYVPQDLAHGPFARQLARRLAPVEPAATHPDHLRGAEGRAERPADSEDQRERFETAPSGNAVVLEEQLIKVAETQMDYQTMTNLYRKHMQMIRMALGRGG